jgi:WhiB family transcriptional regulator, redox-sensing transcriptional regulator
MNRRDRALAYLADHPGLTCWELARALGLGRNSGSFRQLLTGMQRMGQVTAVRQWRPSRGRMVNLWSIAPPGTRPVFVSEADGDRKRDRDLGYKRQIRRERDREYKRRIRAIARGEDPGPGPERATAHRLSLPVAAPDRGRWRLRAACGTEDPELFFATDPADIEKAQRICCGCPVRLQCTLAAEANDERFGVWGGVDRSVQHGELIAS